MADGGDGNVLAFPGIAIADPIEDDIYAKHDVTPTIVKIEPVDRTEALIKEREQTHGPYPLKAQLIQMLKDDVRRFQGWHRLSPAQKESIDMILHKIGRIITGDATHEDHWDDVAGYALLGARNGKPA
jgi:hypothetical protein